MLCGPALVVEPHHLPAWESQIGHDGPRRGQMVDVERLLASMMVPDWLDSKRRAESSAATLPDGFL